MGRWASEHDTLQAFILLGQPWLGGFVGSLHNRMRDEHLKESLFDRLDHACTLIAAWSRATMKSTPTACWAGSHPTNTRSNGNNTTNNDQQLSKYLVCNTGPGHSTTSTTKTSSTRRNPLPNRPLSATNPCGGSLSTGTCSEPSSKTCGLSPASIAKLGRGGNSTTDVLAESAKHPTATSPTFARSSRTIRRSHNDP